MHPSSSIPSGIPTPRPTAKASELFFDFVTVAEEVEAALEGVVPAATVTVAPAADEVLEALGSASPMPSFLLPGSWVSRRRMPKLGRVKLEAQLLLRSHSHTPDAGHGNMFVIELRSAGCECQCA